jgi:hypothetical protein
MYRNGNRFHMITSINGGDGTALMMWIMNEGYVTMVNVTPQSYYSVSKTVGRPSKKMTMRHRWKSLIFLKLTYMENWLRLKPCFISLSDRLCIHTVYLTRFINRRLALDTFICYDPFHLSLFPIVPHHTHCYGPPTIFSDSYTPVIRI